MAELRKESELTEKEKVRLGKFKENQAKLEKDGFESHYLTVTAEKANVMAIVTTLPFIIPVVALFFICGNSFHTLDYGFLGFIIFLAVLFASLVVHEWIHGITYAIFAKNHFKDIEFGIVWKMLTPYCTCSSPLKKYQYFLALIMPGLVLGLIPSIIAIINGSVALLGYGVVMIMGAGGDLLILYLILKNASKKKDVLYHDHPTDVGVVMFDK